MRRKFIFSIVFLVIFFGGVAQDDDFYIQTISGKNIIERRVYVNDCLKKFKKDRTDATALAICECMASKIDKRFTNSQISRFTTWNILQNFTSLQLGELIKTDTLLSEELKRCHTSTNKSTLLGVEAFESNLIDTCYSNISVKYRGRVDTTKLRDYCKCQLDLIKSKKIPDTEIANLHNPNSLIYYQFYYYCDFPLLKKDTIDRSWNILAKTYVEGPDSDTITVLNFKGMTFVKVKIGSNRQVWMLDTGASDLLLTKATEDQLKNDGIITDSSYLGTTEYEMANGILDTCRRYKIDGVKIGKFKINNVIAAVSDKAKNILIGKTILNKFTSWVLDNRNNYLILIK